MSHPVDENSVRPERGKASVLKTLLVSLFIVAIGAGLVWLIFKTEPTATRKEAARETAMLVDVQSVSRGRYKPTIEVLGQVMPAREVNLGSRVSGQVIEQSEAFNPGQRVKEGQLLVRIDPADYESALEQRQSELLQAQADLDLEQGQQAVAKRELELFGDNIETANEALILRRPQQKQAEARLAAARAAVRQAKLALERTYIRAPFPAQVLTREVTLGSQVNVGQALGRLVGTNQYWIEATVPLTKLQWLSFDNNPETSGAAVNLYHDTVWPSGQSRQAKLTQLVGELDSNARMARVLITVDDPLALNESAGQPPLILGTLLRAEIEGRALENVIRLDRALIRRNNTVWVMEDRKLAIHDVTIVLQDENYAYISDGLEEGDQVITSQLASVVSGADLRLEGDRDE
ncbi:efflux RND transporter periplasmic adaptor subunit [Marinobacter sp. CHS3-4]|uniref:efflux RND transporter periplasmic adaptor subunit n=1 Tax=Marinobacter sp. CHS3-4 TaxID=3045174 RepID=UPI0024B5FC45|nr:efflux RND transporter periplasmic adaptor subunit [Marinobacter sp. CHS3-4]MDI9246397.1 efflux RND transporter periplasmic adaptor subunit [Marinobacter sp. CHS3-4]